jgi:predicted glutamine amidotransferase
MCQLIELNLGDATLHRVFLPTLLQIASVGNTDGTGFLTVTEKEWTVYRSIEGASDIEELGMDVRDNVTSNYPVMGHVRYASKGIAITEENTHPFAGSRFILAHNGRLYGKDEKVVYNANDATNIASDSLTFLKELEKVAKGSPKKTFLEILNMTMEEFKGKFAFLIYDSVTDTHYVARGDTADLHVIPIGEIPKRGGEVIKLGFALATKKNTLEDAVTISCKVAQSLTGRRIVFGKTEELKKNTLWKIDGAFLVELGEIKEKPSYSYQREERHFGNGLANSSSSVNSAVPIWKWSEAIKKFMEAHFLGVHDIDAIMKIFLGVNMADCQVDDLNRFVSLVIPKISSSRKIREKISKIIGLAGCIYPVVYVKVPGLQYPWMVNERPLIDKMIKYLEDLDKVKKEKK